LLTTTLMGCFLVTVITLYVGLNVAWPSCGKTLTSKQRQDLWTALAFILGCTYGGALLIKPRWRSVLAASVVSVYPWFVLAGLAQDWSQIVGPGTFCF
jgi:hypothetical protein